MSNLTFFSVLLSNVKCALCKEANCPVKYMPNREKIELYDGHRYIIRCKKDVDKTLDKVLKKIR